MLSRKLQKTKSRLRKVHCREDARALFPIYHDIDRDKAEEAKSCQSHQSQPPTTNTYQNTNPNTKTTFEILKILFLLLICKKQSFLLALDSWLLLHFPSFEKNFLPKKKLLGFLLGTMDRIIQRDSGWRLSVCIAAITSGGIVRPKCSWGPGYLISVIRYLSLLQTSALFSSYF